MQKEINKNLIEYNTFGIEAFCDEFYELSNSSQLVNINFHKNMLILGGGSNMVIKNRLPQVIHIKTKGITVNEYENYVKINVQAGEIWDDFVDFCVRNTYYGAENLSLIPGTVGAAPIQNIGAYGAMVEDIIESVNYFDIEEKKIKIILKNECKFNYRDSIFKNELKGKAIVTSVNFILKKDAALNLNYGNLTNHFKNKAPSVSDIRNMIIQIRQNKLPDTKILGNSGSFFKNSIIDEQKFILLKERFPNIAYYKIDDAYKIPTAWLIETAGLKGFKHKEVAVYEKHALILVNKGGATAQQILELSEIIEERVFEKFGIKIEKEVSII